MLRIIFLILGCCLFAENGPLEKYLDILKEYPERVGREGNYKKGEIEIVLDPKRIKEISLLQKMRFQKMGLSLEASEEASRIGVIAEDAYWILVRDAVIFPTGAEGSYNRIIRKSSLSDGIGGVAILPLLSNKKIALNVNFRHATRSFELEIPRGIRHASESVEKAAMRELEEETGMHAVKQISLGNMAPHTSVSDYVVTVFLSYVDKVGISSQDYSEAIYSVELFTLQEIKEALKIGWIEKEIKGQKQKVYVRDSFLTYALFQAEHQGLLSS